MDHHQKTFLLCLLWISLLFTACNAGVPQVEVAAAPTLTYEETDAIQSTIVEPVVTIQPTFEEAVQPAAGSEDCAAIAFVKYAPTSSDIYTVCPDGSRLTRLTDQPADEFQPAWSPDRKRIAYTAPVNGNNQIFIMDRDGSNTVQLTHDYANDDPVWLPDNRQIAFRTTDNQGLWWWRMIVIESGEIARISEPSYDFFFPKLAWAPDGQRVAYMSLVEQQARNDGASQIHIRNLDGSNDAALTHDTWANISPQWSPDGSRIAFLSERDGNYNSYALYTIDLGSMALKKISDSVFSEETIFSWSPDGQHIVISSIMLPKNITIIDIESGQERELSRYQKTKSAGMPSW